MYDEDCIGIVGELVLVDVVCVKLFGVGVFEEF